MVPHTPPTADDRTAPPLPEGVAPLDERDPRRVGPFRLVGRLGAGGMGVVYAALDETDRRVAVKCAHRAYARDPEFRARFTRETATVRRVRSRSVPAFVGSGADAAVPWLATEYVPGPTLHRYVREHGPLAGEASAAFALGVAEALVAIHAAGVLHRDLKPGNVILAPDGPKVLDFGIARALDESGLTRTGGLVGTPGWISPEQLRGAPATVRSDVFAWANLVVYAATGAGAFGGGDTDTLARRVLHEPPDLGGVARDLRPHLERALAKDPGQRPDATDLIGPLAAGVSGTDEGASAAGPTGQGTACVFGAAWPTSADPADDELERWTANTVPPRPWAARHRRGLTVAAAATVLAVVAGSGALAWDARDPGAGAPGTEQAAQDEADTADADGTDGSAGGGPENGDDTSGASGGADAAPAEDPAVTVEADPDDPASVIRYVEDTDGGEQAQARLTYTVVEPEGEWEGGRLILDVTAEYLMDSGELTLRSNDFGKVTAFTAQDREVVPEVPDSSGGQARIGPEEPEAELRISFFGTHADTLVHYLPPETASEESRGIPVDRPGGVCFLVGQEEGGYRQEGVTPHETTLTDGVPERSCAFDGSQGP